MCSNKFQDQIDHLLTLNIKACTLNSKMTKKDREAVINSLKTNNDITLLYITPEQAATSTFRVSFVYIIQFNR